MTAAVVVVLLAGGVASCFSRAPNQRYQARVVEIDELFDQGVEEVERGFERMLEDIDLFRSHLVEIESDANTEPLEPVSARPSLSRLASKCDEIGRMALSTQDKELSIVFDDCSRRYSELLVSTFVAEYWAADLDWISKEFGERSEELDLESLFVYSHNLRVRGYIAERRRQARAEREAALNELERFREQAVAAAAEARDREIAESRRALGTALAVFGQAMSRTGQPTQDASAEPHAQATQPVGGCSSDFTCGVGSRCIKNNFASQGFCAKAVDAYGVPTHDLPSTESIMVKMPDDADCHFDTDCPVGFKCHPRSGTCRR